MSAGYLLSGLSIEAARRALTAQFGEGGIETPELDARMLIGAALGLDHTGLATQAGRRLTETESDAIARFAQRRLAREPVARIIGRKEFWGLDFELSTGTLIPRPDTETLVEAALEIFQNDRTRELRIADICTGSGAILLALLSEFRKAKGIGTDISAAALAMAALNARRFGLAGRASFVQCDHAAALAGPFDLIVSNPPYIRTLDISTLDRDVRDHDPYLALDGGADGLAAYRAIVPQAAALLRPGGIIIMETGFDQSTPVSELMLRAELALPRPPIADLGGIHRAVVGQKAAF